MAEPFIGEVRIWACNFAPRGWAMCDGQLLGIQQFTVLFAVVGTAYGGNGRSNFALPDLRGRAVMHRGKGPGLTQRRVGSKYGQKNNKLGKDQVPKHRHSLRAYSNESTPGESKSPANNKFARAPDETPAYRSVKSGGGGVVPLSSDAIASFGKGGAVNNEQPWRALNYLIALRGVFPT